MSQRKRTVYFCYADPTGFSGQKAAVELVLHGLQDRGWRCERLPQPVLDRLGERWARTRYLVHLLAAWCRALRLLGSGENRLWVALGQTWVSFVRDAVPLLLARLRGGRERVVISLNGNVFMLWPARSLIARVFRRLLQLAGTVTVVGEGQRIHLIKLGLAPDQVHVVVNSCDVPPIAAARLLEKHALAKTRPAVVRALFLSSLIDTKGYPEYLEALAVEAERESGPRIEAVLCGRIAVSEFAERFRTEAEAAAWITTMIARINGSPRVQVSWIRGAVGEAKADLFRAADLFFLPTHYAVEAQPLVLLEAMASGCAIVTTRAGEIPTILDLECAWFLPDVSAESVATALATLGAEPRLRAQLAQCAHARFQERYQVARHLDRWEELLASPRAGDVSLDKVSRAAAQ